MKNLFYLFFLLILTGSCNKISEEANAKYQSIVGKYTWSYSQIYDTGQGSYNFYPPSQNYYLFEFTDDNKFKIDYAGETTFEAPIYYFRISNDVISICAENDSQAQCRHFIRSSNNIYNFYDENIDNEFGYHDLNYFEKI